MRQNKQKSNIMKHIPFILRIMVALILIQTLRFKFTAHPDSVYIFETVGLEPTGRIGIGILELIAGILLLIPKTVWAGAMLTLGLIGGAIFMHLTQLGIEVNNDHGVLFITAVVTFILSAVILYLYRKNIPIIGAKLKD
ncbi:DoxX family protein [Yeosuana sp. MJ-SS3]|uniref:DoxX family protein n=1 Tax=Gilvirhabdus luticola TaxID=3079858 RepID=A0ABU3UA77_9FLAO|nr:DoxX family protein [Yeosuana sp. MJ-SS3]MDU8887314.1 DoxX family protein [Yeosuana sp. MJ-SS3]